MIVSNVHIGRALEFYGKAMEEDQSFDAQCKLVNVDPLATMNIIDIILQVIGDDTEAGLLMAFFLGILAQREAQRDSSDGGERDR